MSDPFEIQQPNRFSGWLVLCRDPAGNLLELNATVALVQPQSQFLR
jgi:hypothetical protein